MQNLNSWCRHALYATMLATAAMPWESTQDIFCKNPEAFNMSGRMPIYGLLRTS
jgi:hypothetical protein